MNVLITGANSGFGQLIVEELLAAGHTVAGSMRDTAGRNAAPAERLRALGASIVEIDVTDEASVEAGVMAARAVLGRIDALINNVGIGAYGLQENFSAEDFRRLFDINLFGVQRMIRAVLPQMRERGAGLILNISSLLGRVAVPFYGPYNATKWALEALSENYRAEVGRCGVEVALIEPGGFPTGFIGNLMEPSARDRDAGYGAMASAPQESLAHFEGFLAANPQQDPRIVAEAVVAVVSAKPGTRAFRTEVDRLGMGDAVRTVNALHAQVTEGVFASLGMADMLKINTAAARAT